MLFTKTFIASTEGQAPVTFTLECVWLELGSGSKGHRRDMWKWPGLFPSLMVVCKESYGFRSADIRQASESFLWHFCPFLDRIPVTASPSFCAKTGVRLSSPHKWALLLVFKPLQGKRVYNLPPRSPVSFFEDMRSVALTC